MLRGSDEDREPQALNPKSKPHAQVFMILKQALHFEGSLGIFDLRAFGVEGLGFQGLLKLCG